MNLLFRHLNSLSGYGGGGTDVRLLETRCEGEGGGITWTVIFFLVLYLKEQNYPSNSRDIPPKTLTLTSLNNMLRKQFNLKNPIFTIFRHPPRFFCSLSIHLLRILCPQSFTPPFHFPVLSVSSSVGHR